MRLSRIALISVVLALTVLAVPFAAAGCECVCYGKVTGGGWYYCDCYGHKMSFGFNVVRYPEETAIKGELEVQDHTWKWNIHAHEIDTLCVSTDKTWAIFEGPCTINHIPGFRFKVYVEDNNEPGINDVFEIWLYGTADPLKGLPYHAVGDPIDGGNIQIHKKP